MRHIIVIVFCLSSAFLATAQTNSEESKTYNLSAKVGVGITKFAVTGFETDDYPAIATRLGFAISKTVIGNRILVESGLNVYFRAKSKSPLVDEIYWYGKGSLYPLLDKTATQRHIAFEVPITVHYVLTGDRSVNLGLLYRKWQPKDHRPISFLASQNELGLTFGLSQKVIERIRLGLDFFIGFKDFDPSLTIGSSTNVVIRDRSALFSIAYAL
jgi:hypothetical protein